MIIDVHTHICDQNKLKSYQKKSGHKVSKIIAIPWYNSNIAGWADVESLVEFTKNTKNIYAIGSINMDANIEQQLSRHEELFTDKKIFGIKLYPGYQHFYPSDDRVIKIAKLCEKFNRPVIFHSGDFYDQEGTALLKYSHPTHIDELAGRCPKTKIVISHFGFPCHLETANILSKNKNVFTDVSGTIDKNGTSQKDLDNLVSQYISDLKRVFNYYPDVKQKTMFGTDYCGEDSPLNQVTPYIDVIKKTMNKQEQENSFYKLAEKIYFE